MENRYNNFKYFSILLISCFLLNACSNSKSIKKIKFFNEKQKIKITLKSTDDLSVTQRQKFNQAIKLMGSFLNANEFKAFVLKGPDSLNYIDANEIQTKPCDKQGLATYTYNVVKGSCFNNKEIYQVIKSAKWQLNVSVKPYSGLFKCNNPWTNAIGGLEDETIVMYKCKFETMSVELLAGFLIHEYLHAIGFRHPYQPSKNRKLTIPYFIGDHAIQTFWSKSNSVMNTKSLL